MCLFSKWCAYSFHTKRFQVFLIVSALQMLYQLMLLMELGYVILTVMEGLYERPLSPRKVGISRMK
jgi:hypothetical protein